MFEVIAKIYNGNTLVGYEVLDTSTNRKKVMSVDTVQGLAIAKGLVNAAFNEKTNTLTGINGCDLRSLPRKQEAIGKSSDIGLNCFFGKSLSVLVNENTANYRERYLVEELMSFLNSPCNGRICALYGLRRTGKTIMMYHSIKRLLNDGRQNVVYISLTERDSLAAMYQKLEEFVHQGMKYLFIDEITAVNGFIQSSALLADKYAKMGMHIVIAGTDSYILELAGQKNLYDRMTRINTTYIGYKEYEYLNPGTSILDYIHIGGVLPADIFYNEQKTKDYINTAIVDNIVNSLLRANNRKEHQHLLELNERGLLRKAIEQAIEASNEELTVGVITKSYVNGTLGSAMQLLEAVFDVNSTLDVEEVEDRVRYKLSILRNFDAQISEEYVEELKDYLIDIGVIKMYSRYVCSKRRARKVEVPVFIQPGLRYRQTVALINALCETASFFQMPKSVRTQLQQKIIEDVEGNLVEHEVILHHLLGNRDKNVEITQLTYEGKEIDMIIHNSDTLYLFEIKRSSEITEQQMRWLVNDEMNDYLEQLWGCEIKRRVVLYLGEERKVDIEGIRVEYQNINRYLKNH